MWNLLADRRHILTEGPAPLGGPSRLDAEAAQFGHQQAQEGHGMEKLQAFEAVKRDVADTRSSLELFSAIMAEMSQQGKRDTPEFQEILHEYQEMSHLVTEALKLLKARDEQEQGERREAQVHAAACDFTGVNPIKGTLGPAGLPGATSRGPEIANLQKFLTAAGFPVPASAEFDVKTRLAVQQFQSRYGLKPDGVVGAAMRKVVNDLLQQPGAPPV